MPTLTEAKTFVAPEAQKAEEGPFDVRLVAVRYAARDTNLYEFRRVDGKPLPTCRPGDHIDIHLPNGFMRQYSLVDSGDNPKSYVIGVKRDPNSRGGSKYLHERLIVGTVVKISAPRNNFALVESAGHTVLVAGGIGITPIWCMAQRLTALGRTWELHYSCRSREDMAFLEILQGMKNVQMNFDVENNGKFLDLKTIAAAAPAGAHFYCCGPAPMLNAFEAATAALPAEQVHVEYFTAKESAALEGGYTVVLNKSGREFTIPKGRTILQVLRDSGIETVYSCEEGICGACEVKVVSGTPDHRDSILTESERVASKSMMICCSGSKSDRLVLDM